MGVSRQICYRLANFALTCVWRSWNRAGKMNVPLPRPLEYFWLRLAANFKRHEAERLMSKQLQLRLSLLTVLMMGIQVFAAAGVIVYPESPLPRATEFIVKANGQDIAVYNAGTFRCAPFAFSGSVTVEVAYARGTIHAYQINPVSKGIVVRQNGNTLAFTLNQPEKLEIQINGATSQVADGDKLLYLFADAPEVNAPKFDDASVLYFGPGNHDLPGGELKIDDSNPHSALYVAPGAVLNASLDIKRTRPFKIFGRGFIQNPFTTKGHYALGLKGCIGLEVEDVVFFNSIWHGIKILGGHDNVVRNVKTLHYVVNSDGVSLQGSTASNLVDNCFIVGNDNLIVIGGARDPGALAGNVIRGCTFIKSSYAGNWAFPQGNGGIGPGNLVDDCDVVRCNGEVGWIRMVYGTPTTMDNLTFQNIRVQSLAGYQPDPQKDGKNRLLSLEADGPEYARTLTLKNIYLPSAQTSFITPGRWTIIFDHVYVNGRAATCDADLKLTKGEGVATRYYFNKQSNDAVRNAERQL